jgi:transposase
MSSTLQEQKQEIRVCIDVGSEQHYVAIALSTGELLQEFPVRHTSEDIKRLFEKIESLKESYKLPVVMAMEAYNGYARPIDSYALDRGYRLYNVNNTKLARFREVFPGPAKSDPLDTKLMMSLFTVCAVLPAAKNVLQLVHKGSEVNEKLKHYTRRRRVLVDERTRTLNRLQGDLQAVCPGILSITGDAGNLWFLRFLTCREDISKLTKIQLKGLLQIGGVGKHYAGVIQEWQKTAEFSSNAVWMGKTIIRDAKMILQFHEEIAELDGCIAELNSQSGIATRLKSIPGFGETCAAELAGEIGQLSRFNSESSLALYVGMATLDRKSGKYQGSRPPRHVNTRAKSALMIAVARHIDLNPEAKRFYDKKRAEGKKHNQSVRALGRHLIRVIWSMLRDDRDYRVK